jgi:nicotinamidase/pyrazinamidase
MKTVFFDVDTQLDFLFPAGALAVPGAENIVPALDLLTRFASSHQIPLLSTADAHSEDDPEFKLWKPHCVAGTAGQQKVAVTLLNQRIVLGSSPREAPQIIIEKQNIDCFTNPNLRPLLQSLGAARYIVYGVASEVCVRCAVFGLLETGVRVELVTDAIKNLSPAAEKDMIERFQSAGGQLTTVAAVTS